MIRSRITFPFEPTYSLSWKALLSVLQAKGDKWDTNVHGLLDLTHSDHVRDLSSKLNGMSGHSLIVYSPMIAFAVGSHPSHSTPYCQVHFQEKNILMATIAGPWLHLELGNNMAERQGIYL